MKHLLTALAVISFSFTFANLSAGDCAPGNTEILGACCVGIGDGGALSCTNGDCWNCVDIVDVGGGCADDDITSCDPFN